MPMAHLIPMPMELMIVAMDVQTIQERQLLEYVVVEQPILTPTLMGP